MDVSCVALIVPISIHFPHGPVDQKHTARFTNKETEAGGGLSYARAWLELRSLLHFTCGSQATASPPPWPLRTLFKSWFTLESCPVQLGPSDSVLAGTAGAKYGSGNPTLPGGPQQAKESQAQSKEEFSHSERAFR